MKAEVWFYHLIRWSVY